MSAKQKSQSINGTSEFLNCRMLLLLVFLSFAIPAVGDQAGNQVGPTSNTLPADTATTANLQDGGSPMELASTDGLDPKISAQMVQGQKLVDDFKSIKSGTFTQSALDNLATNPITADTTIRELQAQSRRNVLNPSKKATIDNTLATFKSSIPADVKTKLPEISMAHTRGTRILIRVALVAITPLALPFLLYEGLRGPSINHLQKKFGIEPTAFKVVAATKLNALKEGTARTVESLKDLSRNLVSKLDTFKNSDAIEKQPLIQTSHSNSPEWASDAISKLKTEVMSDTHANPAAEGKTDAKPKEAKALHPV